MNFKKILCITSSIMLVFCINAIGVFAEDDISVLVDNQKVTFTQQAPIIKDGRTLVPLREVFEKAGATVEWTSNDKPIIIKNDTFNVSFTINEAYIYKNGKTLAIDVPAQLINSKTMIPVRAISEALDYGVTWNEMNRSVLVSTAGKKYSMTKQWSAGFLDIKDAGVYMQSEVNNLQIDLNGDKNAESISFKPQKEDQKAILSINSTDFSEFIPDEFNGVKAIAIVDVDAKDKYKEIILIDGEDHNIAWFFRYNGVDLLSLKCNSTPEGYVPYLDKLYFDGMENIISDMDGICFTEYMSCTGMYSLEDLNINRYSLDATKSIGDTMTKIADGNMVYWSNTTSKYQKGKYISGQIKEEKQIFQNDFPQSFKILDCYVDDTNPSNYEFYIEFTDTKEKAVIWTYES